MITIGLTGASGSGKSYITQLLSRFGFPTFNADAIVHELYSSKNACTEMLAKHFGNDVLHSDHSVNRQALGAIVFSDKSKLFLLNHIVHPFVLSKIDSLSDEARRTGAKAVIIDAPQLFESGLDQKCDFIFAVIADEKTRVSRLKKRDGIDEERIRKRLANQYDDSFFRKRAHYCIENSNGDDPLSQVVTILREIGLYHE